MTDHKAFCQILGKAKEAIPLSREEIGQLLSLNDTESIRQLMATAQGLRNKHFGNKCFLYGFIYFSTYCQNQCTFCFYRKTNSSSPRYRKTLAEVKEIAGFLADAGVHLIDLTMGEDPLIHQEGNFHLIFQMVEGIKEETNLPVMVSPGVVPQTVLQTLARLKTDWYALYQETHNPGLFQKLRVGQSFEERKANREFARQTGMLVEDGILLGVGETLQDQTNSIIDMKQNGAAQVRMMSFIPQKQTPLATQPSPPRVNEFLGIAIMRLVMPRRLIPASLDVDGIHGLKKRLAAGANVVTSLIPPNRRLAGVSQSHLDINQGLRTVPAVKKVLDEVGLEIATLEEYRSWMFKQQKSQVGLARPCGCESV